MSYMIIKDAIESAGTIVFMLCATLLTVSLLMWMNRNSK